MSVAADAWAWLALDAPPGARLALLADRAVAGTELLGRLAERARVRPDWTYLRLTLPGDRVAALHLLGRPGALYGHRPHAWVAALTRGWPAGVPTPDVLWPDAVALGVGRRSIYSFAAAVEPWPVERLTLGAALARWTAGADGPGLDSLAHDADPDGCWRTVGRADCGRPAESDVGLCARCLHALRGGA